MIPPRPPAPRQTVIPLSLSKLLLAEGSTPMHFFEAILQDLGIADQIEVRNFRGINELKSDIAAYAKSAAFQ